MPVLRPAVLETTALGAAYLAGLGVGLYESLEDVAGNWTAETKFTPGLSAELRESRLADWSKYVHKLLS
jgi:glycerol kinase